jgi:ABC-2 type transport system ATP-binding protein
MNALEVRNLTKIYTNRSENAIKTALSDFSLDVEQGSIFGLLGPNGAGKSTLINILSGTVRKTSGYASIMGVDIDEDPRLAKYKIGVVPQEVALDTFFPVEEALEFYAGYFGIRPENRKTKEILEALGLSEKAKSTARQLSGGMKRRFLVAKAMVHSPGLLILDEPTAGVDIELRDQLWDYVKKLNKEGTTIILTTHYLEEAEKLCDRIGFISNGKLVKCDSKQNLLLSLSHKEIIVETESKIESVPADLKKYEAEIINPNTIKIKFNKKEISLKQIIDGISSSGINISDISIKEGNLEEVFREIYRGESSK